MKQFSFTPALFTIEAAAFYLGVSRATIEEWFADGRLRQHHLPPIRGRETMRKVVFTREELEKCAGLPTVLLTPGRRQ